MDVAWCCQQARMKARPPLAVAAVSTPSTPVSAAAAAPPAPPPPPPPPSSSFVVQQGQNGVVSPPNYTVSSATVGPLTTPKCAYQTLPAVQYIQHPVSNAAAPWQYFISAIFKIVNKYNTVFQTLTNTKTFIIGKGKGTHTCNRA